MVWAWVVKAFRVGGSGFERTTIQHLAIEESQLLVGRKNRQVQHMHWLGLRV